MQQYSDDEISSEEDEEDLGVEEDDQVQAAELPPKEVDPRILEEYINKPDVLRLAKIHKSRFQHFDIQQAFQRMYKGKLIDMTVGCQNALAKQMLWDWANQIDKRTFPEDVKNKWLFDEVLRRVTQVEDGPCRKNLALRMKLDQLAKDRELIDIVGLAWDNYEPKNRQLLVEDISHGLSSCPIPVYCDLPGESGDVFKEPPEFDYIQKNVLNLNPEYKRSGITYSCNCIDGCKKDTCACIELNKEMNMYEGPILKDGRVCIRKPTTDVYSYALFCCGPLCGCPPSCPNRIEEILKRSRVEVYRSDTTVGFRARTLTSLAFGELVAEFTGEVKASNVNMDYSLELGSYRDRSIIDRLKIAFESDTLDERHWAGALPQHQIFIDPFKKGNEARFFSHGCFPNLQVLRVVTNYISTEMHRLVFFASRPIVAGTELCFNYGTSYVKRAQFDCQCRTLLCRSNDGCWYNFKSGLKLMDIQMIVKQIIQRWKVQVSIYDDLLEKIYDEAKRRGLEGFVDAPCNVPNCFNVKEELRNQPGIDEALSKWPRLKKKR